MYAFENWSDVLEFKKIRILYQALIKSIIKYYISINYYNTFVYKKAPDAKAQKKEYDIYI